MIRRSLALSALLVAVVSSIVAQPVIACTEDGSEGFFPKNDLRFPVGIESATTEREFNQILDEIEEIYTPIVASMGAKLQVQRRWTDATVNAYANRSGKTWMISMFGGLARHPEITSDAFALVACHEMGHHLGGDPKVPFLFFFESWATNEGQSDYYGTLKCMRRLFANDDNRMAMLGVEVPASVQKQCQASFRGTEEVALCERSAMAGLSLGRVLASLRKGPMPEFDTPDPKVVRSTFHKHPAAQCRLDTYFAGAICAKDKGMCTSADPAGARPLCWYKPKRGDG